MVQNLESIISFPCIIEMRSKVFSGCACPSFSTEYHQEKSFDYQKKRRLRVGLRFGTGLLITGSHVIIAPMFIDNNFLQGEQVITRQKPGFRRQCKFIWKKHDINNH
ncbi:hypothetical protein KJ966_20165 [bacterium]|nr:hypothetical protein [bacterium]